MVFFKYTIAGVLCLLLNTNISFSQEINGKVSNKNQEKLPGVSVVIKGTCHGTTTDINRKYIINTDSSSKTLLFFNLDYINQEINILGKDTINVRLEKKPIEFARIEITGIYKNKYDEEDIVQITKQAEKADTIKYYCKSQDINLKLKKDSISILRYLANKKLPQNKNIISCFDFICIEKGFFDYFSSKLKYPKIALENYIVATIYTKFTIDSSGNIKNIEILNFVDTILTNEVKNAIEKIPKWLCKGLLYKEKSVEIDFLLPISFEIDEKNSKFKREINLNYTVEMDKQTKFFNNTLKLINAKKLVSKTFLNPKRTKKFKFPNKLKKEFKTTQFLLAERNVVTLEPKLNRQNKHIIFLHGGAYCVEANASHWWAIEQIIKKTDFTISFIDYPLSPENTYKEAYQMVFDAYLKLIETYPNDVFYLIGDSAGGGFCLAFAEWLRDKNFSKLPQKIALLSPWLDLSMSNPDIEEFQKKDFLLDPEALLFCAKNFAGDLDLKNPMLSPIFGDLNNLNDIAIFVGSEEIFLSDCKILKEKLINSNTKFQYKEYNGMQHDWLIFRTKNSKILINDIVDFFKI